MMLRRWGFRAALVAVAALLLGLGSASAPAEAGFTATASVSLPASSATLQPPTLVALPGGIVCLATVTVTWTPSISFVTGALTGFDPAQLQYKVILKNGPWTDTKTVVGGGQLTVDFTVGTLLGNFSATVQTLYKGWTSTVTSSTVNRGCLA